ncbi:MAG: short-chain dehydrogenase/reductase [Candidatus Binatia bacterium]|nr:MAG: short-chain dehydrogenase/reductase [Candidatus Binatia bacterium]
MKAEGTALVTGSSRGLGRALALELARRGFEVVATMRNPEAGRDLAKEAGDAAGRILVERLDLVDPGTFRIPPGLRVLVNNAAIEEAYLPVEETPLDQWRRVFETNVFGLVELTRRAIPVLRKNGGGVICNITSSSLLVPTPFYAVYRASKAAVSALGESLRAELAPFGIRVLEILPGPVETDMLAHSNRRYEAEAFEPYRPMAERSYENRKSLFSSTPAADAARTIADAILDDRSPLRRACDPMGEQMLEAWRQMSDEEWMKTLLSSLWGVEVESG